jgi:hypothetical protein
MAVGGVLIRVGVEPNTQLFHDQLVLDGGAMSSLVGSTNKRCQHFRDWRRSQSAGPNNQWGLRGRQPRKLRGALSRASGLLKDEVVIKRDTIHETARKEHVSPIEPSLSCGFVLLRVISGSSSFFSSLLLAIR